MNPVPIPSRSQSTSRAGIAAPTTQIPTLGFPCALNLAELCYARKQHFARCVEYLGGMAESLLAMSPTILAANLKRLMAATPSLDTQDKLAARSGVSQTSLSLMMRPNDRGTTKSGKTPSPKLSEVELVARAFDLKVWQLLADTDELVQVFAQAVSGGSTLAPLHKVKGQTDPSRDEVEKSIAVLTDKSRRASNKTVRAKMPEAIRPDRPELRVKAAAERAKMARRVKRPPADDLVSRMNPEGGPE